MIRKISVKNYKGFKETIVLDFSRHKDYKYNEHVIQNDLINTAVIYGKNASGKSNFGLALFDITLHLVDKEKALNQQSHYLNAGSDETEAEFSYEFLIDKKKILYRYKKSSNAQLDYEEFHIDGAKVFSYNFKTKIGDFENLKLVSAQTLNVQSKDMNISILRYIANNANIEKRSTLRQFMDFVNNMLWFRSLGINQYIGYGKGIEIITENIIENGKVGAFEKLLRKSGVEIFLDIATDPMGKKHLVVKFSNNKILPFWDIASSGTHALTLYFYWSQKFNDISFLFIDEFDAFYHTDLAQEILKDLSKNKNTQVILTTHNTQLMTNKILRPDCYFIITKGKLIPLTKCTERELREGHNLSKMYKNGEFIV